MEPPRNRIKVLPICLSFLALYVEGKEETSVRDEDESGGNVYTSPTLTCHWFLLPESGRQGGGTAVLLPLRCPCLMHRVLGWASLIYTSWPKHLIFVLFGYLIISIVYPP